MDYNNTSDKSSCRTWSLKDCSLYTDESSPSNEFIYLYHLFFVDTLKIAQYNTSQLSYNSHLKKNINKIKKKNPKNY